MTIAPALAMYVWCPTTPAGGPPTPRTEDPEGGEEEEPGSGEDREGEPGSDGAGAGRTSPPVPDPGAPVAALCVHGWYPSVEEARAAIAALAAAEGGAGEGDAGRWDRDPHVAVSAYVVDDVGRWLPVLEPLADARVAADDVEEVAGPENDDPAHGRCGSVCEMRRRGGGDPREPVGGTASPILVQPGASAVVADRTARARDARAQQSQLEDLLRAPPPRRPPRDAAGYAALRGRCATLRAFARKLDRLVAEAVELCAASDACYAALDADHPDYAGAYRANYERALRQVGMAPESVPLVRYLGTD